MSEKNIIKSILETFHYSTTMPITCLENNDVISSMGLSVCDLQYLKYNDVISKVSVAATTSTQTIDINNFKFSFMHISSGDTVDNIFLIGPYKSSNTTSENTYTPFECTIAYRPTSCIDYIFDLLQAIVKDSTSYNSKNNTHMHLTVKKAIEIIHKDYRDEITIHSLSETLDINKCYFCSLFKKETGMTFSHFLNKYRCEKSKEILLSTDFSLLSVAFEVGFNNQSYYSMAFKKHFGETPLEFKKRNAQL